MTFEFITGEKEFWVRLGQRLRQSRVQSNMTQQVAADKLGLTITQIEAFETGSQLIDCFTLIKSAALYGVHPVSLLSLSKGDDLGKERIWNWFQQRMESLPEESQYHLMQLLESLSALQHSSSTGPHLLTH